METVVDLFGESRKGKQALESGTYSCSVGQCRSLTTGICSKCDAQTWPQNKLWAIYCRACEARPRDKTHVHVICEQNLMSLEFFYFHEALPNLTLGQVLGFFPSIFRKNIFRLLVEKLGAAMTGKEGHKTSNMRKALPQDRAQSKLE